MRIGSLFSGAGGLDIAVQNVFGGDVIWHCENDPAASKVLAAHWPTVPNHGDIITHNWNATEPIDILVGGFPCQDVSSAGNRAGMEHGNRSGLWVEMARIIGLLSPQLVVIENVEGLLNAKAHRHMERYDPVVGNGPDRFVLRAAGAVLGDLADLGYDAQWATVTAASVGAPHRRERVFMLAHTPGAGLPRYLPQTAPGLFGRSSDGELLTTPQARDYKGTNTNHGGPWQSLPRDLADLTPDSHSPHGSIAAATDEGLQPADVAVAAQGIAGYTDAPAGGYGPLLPTPQAADSTGGKTRRESNGISGTGKKQSINLPEIANLLPTPAASDGISGGPNNPENRLAQGHHVQLIDLGMLPPDKWGRYSPAIKRWETLTRPAPNPLEPYVAKTRANSAGGTGRLNSAFAEWMMGWPDGWVTQVPGISRNDKLRIIGNGVVPQQASAALQWLLTIAQVGAA